MEHFGARVLYRTGKANVLADYLSRTPEIAYTDDERKERNKQITRPEYLNKLNLQAIFEHIAYDQPLSSNLDRAWIRKHFAVHNNELYMVAKHSRDPGDPLHSGGLFSQATMLLQIPEYGELQQQARNAHYSLGHGSAGAMQRRLTTMYWHSELVLAVQQAVAECPQCQLMKRPDLILPNLLPIRPPPPMTRWAIDHTFWKGLPILVIVEYITSWVEAEFVPSKAWPHTLPMLTKVQNRFGSPRKLINNNAPKFSDDTAKSWHKKHGTRILFTIPQAAQSYAQRAYYGMPRYSSANLTMPRCGFASASNATNTDI
jgi:hypothetical protein